MNKIKYSFTLFITGLVRMRPAVYSAFYMQIYLSTTSFLRINFTQLCITNSVAQLPTYELTVQSAVCTIFC